MSPMASQITGVLIVFLTVCSDADQRKHQNSASLAFVRGIHRWPVNSPHEGPVTRKWWRHHAQNVNQSSLWVRYIIWCKGIFHVCCISSVIHIYIRVKQDLVMVQNYCKFVLALWWQVVQMYSIQILFAWANINIFEYLPTFYIPRQMVHALGL